MKRFLLHGCGLLMALSVSAATYPNIFTTNSIGDPNQFSQSAGVASIANAAKTTNFVTFGSTNYFASDAAANTNGPISIYRDTTTTPNLLVEDVVIGDGTRGKFDFRISTAFGLADYFRMFVNTEHDAAPGSPANSELQITVPNSIGIGVGVNGRLGNGHIQIFSGLTGGYGSYNQWLYFQNQGPGLAVSSPTGFSGGLVFKTSMLQGAAQVDFYPGVYSYSILTNAPGRYGLALTMDLGNGGANAWDPNTAKPKQSWVALGGDIQNFQLNVGSASPTNLMPVGFNPDFNVPVCIASTNNVVVFQPCTNVDSTKTLAQGYITVWVTNTAPATPRAIVAPVNCRTNIQGVNSGGLAFVTNLTECRFYQYGQKFTNMSVTAWY